MYLTSGNLFAINGFCTRVLDQKDDRKILENFCEQNKDYYEMLGGEGCFLEGPRDILEDLPPGKSYQDKLVIGAFDNKNNLMCVADIIRDYPIAGTWVIGLMLIDIDVRGQGCGALLNAAIEKLIGEAGGETLRLGVLEINKRAYEFWKHIGYKGNGEIKEMTFGQLRHSVIVMEKKVIANTSL